MLFLSRLKKVKNDIEMVLLRLKTMKNTQTGVNSTELDFLVNQIPSYDALIHDIEKGNSHDSDKQLVDSVILTEMLIRKINQSLDHIQKL